MGGTQANEDIPLGTFALWMRAVRFSFIFVTIVSASVGASAGYFLSGTFHFPIFLWSLVVLVSAHFGANLSNDYFDHLSGNDAVNKRFTLFNGGSRVIQEGLLRPQAILRAAIFSFSVSIGSGIYLLWTFQRWEWLWIGVLGISIAFFYTARPIAFVYHGIGELAIVIAFGPLVVGGAYLAQAWAWSNSLWLVSLPIGLLAAAILLINEVPDREADALAKKQTLVVSFGSSRAIQIYASFFIAAYAMVSLATFLEMLPITSLLVFLTFPGSIWLVREAYRQRESEERGAFISVCRGTILLQITFSLFLIAGLLLA